MSYTVEVLSKENEARVGMPLTFWDALRHLNGDVNAATEYAETHWEHAIEFDARA